MASDPNAPETLADLLRRLGRIPPSRVRLKPPPGRATEKDLLRILDRENRPCELVEGTLVEKAMGLQESVVALRLGRKVGGFAEEHDLGVVAGADGTVRLDLGLVRIPDVAFYAWRHFPNKQVADTPIPTLAPDLAVEVLSKGNTAGEIRRKLKEYFLAGTTLAWVVDPKRRTVAVYTAPDRMTMLVETDTLNGGTVLPGFALPVREVFGNLAPAGGGVKKPRGRRPTR
jgi:Uma2 family endonuclease